jgi:hypothetical protein
MAFTFLCTDCHQHSRKYLLKNGLDHTKNPIEFDYENDDDEYLNSSCFACFLSYNSSTIHERRERARKNIQAVAERNIAAEISRREHTETEDPAIWRWLMALRENPLRKNPRTPPYSYSDAEWAHLYPNGLPKSKFNEVEFYATWAKEIQEEKDEKEAVSGLKNLNLQL